MANIAETVKKQTDRILRQRALNATEGVVVSGVSSGIGAPAPTVNNPTSDLTAHKASADHDGRYYTEAELDAGQLDNRYFTESEINALLNFLSLSDTPAAYTGQGSKIVAVKADVSGLEFVAAPAAANGVPTGGNNNQLLAKDGATDYVVKWMDAPAAANGLPQGGVAGQILEKIDGTDYNTQWADPSRGSPLTTKGDVYVYGSADARLPIGADGQVLTADSGETLGVKWVTDVRGIPFAIYGIDLTTALKVGYPAPLACTITGGKIQVGTSPTGAALICDVHKNGTTLWTTQGNRPTIAADGTSANITMPDVTSIEQGDLLEFQIDQIGSTVAGKDLSLTLYCKVVT